MQPSSSHNYQATLLPAEEMLEIGKKKRIYTIGIPLENESGESRISLTPLAVKALINNGHKILVERKAGEGSRFSDLNFSEAGAIITENKEEVFRCDILLKIAPLTIPEIDLLHSDQIILSSLQFPSLTDDYIRLLMLKKVTAIAHELIKDERDIYPIVEAMSEISGSTSILIAAEYLSSAHDGKGVLLGGFTGITPTEVIILGAGTASEFAARTALGLGASVKIFDPTIHNLPKLQYNLGQRLFTSIMNPTVLKKTLQSAYVVIGALENFDPENQYIVPEEMVQAMKPGAVIIDLGISQGGCFETSVATNHKNPTYKRFSVVHYCVPNVPSRVARTSSIALSDIITQLVQRISESGGLRHHLRDDAGLRKGVYIYKGVLTNNYIGRRLSITSNDIDLLMPMFE